MLLRGLVVSAVLLLAALLRLSDLDRTSLDSADLAVVATARLPRDEMSARLRQAPGATPLPYLVVRAALSFGLRETPVRLPFALIGIGATAAALLLLHDLFGARTAWSAALVLAAAPLAVGVARSPAPLGLAAATAVMWTWLAWRVLRRGQGVWWCIAGGAIALYSGYGALAVAAGGTLVAVLGWSGGAVPGTNAGRLLLAFGAALALFAPWLVRDFATEPGAQWALPLDITTTLTGLPVAVLFGERTAAPLQTTTALVVAGLALVGLLVALRRAPLAGAYAAAILLCTLVGTLGAARLAPHAFSVAQLLAALPLYLGLAAFGFEFLVRAVPSPSLWTPLMLAAAAIVAVVEWPAALARIDAPAAQDWRGSFDVVLANLGAEDRVGVPIGRDAADFYGLELQRRLQPSPRFGGARAWLQSQDHGWLILDRGAALHADWPPLEGLLRQRFVVDLGPSASPQVIYFDRRRRNAWKNACHFALPAAALARGSLLRDCLVEVGPVEGPLRQAALLARSSGVSLRNPSLLEAVALLAQSGNVPAARALAAAIAGREPDWADARAALAALPPG